MKLCSIEDCSRPLLARGWCSLHYQRWARHGDPLHETRRSPVCIRGHPIDDAYRKRNGQRSQCRRCLLSAAAELRAVNREVIRAAKSVPCMDCGGVFPPVCMDFDHRDPATKSYEVSAMRSLPTERVLEEIAKCDVVCANCHRLRTHGDD